MPLSQKRPPSVESNERAWTQVYDDMNEIINAVNQGDTTVQKDTSKGKSGDLRLVKTSDGTYYLEGKSNEGWLRSTAFSFRDKE
tara:strand:- start:811 stop:1062 length:252 start_codon:yes stop_codon:yes gene_type:complete